MSDKYSLTLGDVQETLLIPLHGRAVETGKKHPILRDPAAVEMVSAIDYDFTRFGRGTGVMGLYLALGTATFDEYVRDFLAQHPAGTVVEIGAGLSTRYERLDNGEASWVDIDLPDAAEVRQMFFPDLPRKRTIGSSILDEHWIPAVTKSPGPYLFVAEGVLVYLRDPDVRRALHMITTNFPDCQVALDTYAHWVVRQSRRRGPLAATRASLAWACDDPRDVEKWGLDLRLVGSRTLAVPPERVRRGVPWQIRAVLWLITVVSPKSANGSRINLYRHEPGA